MSQTCPDCFPQFLKINEYSITSMIYVQLVVVQQKRNLHNVQRTKPFHGKKCWIEISINDKIPLNLVSKEITMYLCFSKKMWGFCFDWVKQKYNICKSLIFFGIFFSNLHTCSLFLSLPLSKSLSTILNTNWQVLGRWPDFPVTTTVSSSSYFPSNSYKKKKWYFFIC